MALNKKTLSDALFDAETKDTDMTSEARAKVKDRCDSVASAIYDFVTSAEVLIDVLPGIPVATAGSPAAQTGATQAAAAAAAQAAAAAAAAARRCTEAGFWAMIRAGDN